jgi:hypothetical protein
MNPEKKLIKLQAKVNKFNEKMKQEIYALCEKMQYQDSSRFSYNIDRLEAFTRELNDFKILNK